MKSLPKDYPEIWGGVECTINRVQDAYFNQLTYSGHYERENDIELFADLGIKKMRYPILWEQHQPIKNQAINWKRTETKLNALREHGVDVIAGLVHHGSGPSYVCMTDQSFASGLAAYAEQVAKKFPWINYYTPVNEPLTTARFCGLYGLWHPHEQNDACFCRILVNECKATALAMELIRSVNPNALLVQTDDLSKVHSTPSLAYQAEFENQRRWLGYDLLCGQVKPGHALWAYLTSNGIDAEELFYFCEKPCPPDILGGNYYVTSERYLDEATENYPLHSLGGNGRQTYADVEAVRVGEVRRDGIRKLIKEAWERYHIPIAVTEVHLNCSREEQMRWLNDIWLTAKVLRDEGVPVLAVTPWALLGSFGWDQLLTGPKGTYEPGVFDCSGGQPRPTILASMIKAFSRNKTYRHPALDNPGWWQRHCRVIYGHDESELPVEPVGRFLAVCGSQSTLLINICRQRYLKTVEGNAHFLTDGNCWARITVNEEIQIDCFGRKTLTVFLGEDKNRSINATLDLFIDGESGYWAPDTNGALIKQSAILSSQAIAS